MIRSGDNSPLFTVSFVKHELRKDVEATLFSIHDKVVDRNGKPITYKDKTGEVREKLYYLLVTVWEDIPLFDGDQVRLLSYSDLSVFQMTNKAGYTNTYYSISATVEIVKQS